MSGQTHKSAKPTDNGGAKKVPDTRSVKTSKPATATTRP